MTTEELFKPFEITSVCRADLKEKFSEEDIALLDDDDMRHLASKLADDYCEQLFWSSLQIIAEYIIERKKGALNESV
jgi:hypothetical protein